MIRTYSVSKFLLKLINYIWYIYILYIFYLILVLLIIRESSPYLLMKKMFILFTIFDLK